MLLFFTILDCFAIARNDILKIFTNRHQIHFSETSSRYYCLQPFYNPAPRGATPVLPEIQRKNMADKRYESTFLLGSNLGDDALSAIVTKFEDIINKNGGKLIETERWGARR